MRGETEAWHDRAGPQVTEGARPELPPPAPAVGGRIKEVCSVGPSSLGHGKFRSAPNVAAGPRGSETLRRPGHVEPYQLPAAPPCQWPQSSTAGRRGSESQRPVRMAPLREACPWRRLRPDDLISVPDQPLRLGHIRRPPQPPRTVGAKRRPSGERTLPGLSLGGPRVGVGSAGLAVCPQLPVADVALPPVACAGVEVTRVEGARA